MQILVVFITLPLSSTSKPYILTMSFEFLGIETHSKKLSVAINKEPFMANKTFHGNRKHIFPSPDT